MGPCLVCWICKGDKGSSSLWLQLWTRVTGDVALLHFGCVTRVPCVEDYSWCRELGGQLPWELQSEFCGMDDHKSFLNNC